MNRRFVERMKKVLEVIGFLAVMFTVGAAGAVILDDASLISKIPEFATGIATVFICVQVYRILDVYIDRDMQAKRRRMEREHRQAQLKAQLKAQEKRYNYIIE